MIVSSREISAFEATILGAEDGRLNAMVRAAIYYAEGIGCEVSADQSHFWMCRAYDRAEDRATRKWIMDLVSRLSIGARNYWGGSEQLDVALGEEFDEFLKLDNKGVSEALSTQIAEEELERRRDVLRLLEECSALRKRGELASRFRLLLEKAELGVPEAQLELAECYGSGVGVRRSRKRYLEWMEKSAKQNCYSALCALGVDYLLGQGVEIDRPRALRYLHAASKAAFEGAASQDGTYMSHADYVLGLEYANPDKSGCDYDKAIHHFVLATKFAKIDAFKCAIRLLEKQSLPCHSISMAEDICQDVLLKPMKLDWGTDFADFKALYKFAISRLKRYAAIPRCRINGSTFAYSEWSAKTQIPERVIRDRVGRGLSDDEILGRLNI